MLFSFGQSPCIPVLTNLTLLLCRLTVEDVHIIILTRSDYSDGSLPAVLLLYHVRLSTTGGEVLGSCLVGERSVIELSWFHAAGTGWFRSCACSVFGLRDGFGSAHFLCRNGETTWYAYVYTIWTIITLYFSNRLFELSATFQLYLQHQSTI